MIALYELYDQNKNAPEFIYSILYNTTPPMIRGRSANHPQQVIDNVGIDKDVPEKAIKLLNNISQIEPRSSCQGSDKEHPTFFIFRFTNNPNQKYIKSFCDNLSKNDQYKCGFEIGRQGLYRIGITNHLWYSEETKDEFNKWWLLLPEEIKRVINVIDKK